jgi:hypothetical protein
LVILEQGTQVRPTCGADQTRPVAYTNPNLPQPRTLRDWGKAISMIVVGIGIMAGILWHNLGTQGVSRAVEAAGVAAKSMRDLRAALSDYALSAKDAYPTSLQALGDRASQPTQAACHYQTTKFITSSAMPYADEFQGIAGGYASLAVPAEIQSLSNPHVSIPARR